MTDDLASRDDDIWEYVPPGEADAPEPPVGEQLYTGLSIVHEMMAGVREWASGEGMSEAEESPRKDQIEEEDTSLPDAMRDRVAPPPHWTGAVAALGDVLGPKAEALQSPTLVYEAGYHGAPSILTDWGAREQVPVLEPPPRDRFEEEDGAAWVAAQRTEGTPWVLPHLERWWERTPEGVAFVRSLLDAWAEGALGRGAIGVDRHAWRYLRRAWPGQVSNRYFLRPLSGEALTRWFQELALQGGASAGTVEERGTGGRVLSGSEEESKRAMDPTEENDPPSTFLQSLAAYSGGDPGVAWSLWRQSLQAPGPDATESSVAEVPHWSSLPRPERPSDLTRADLLLLHALVLHGGLTDAFLARVVPTGRYERRDRLRMLSREGLLEKANDAWRVTPSGYPVVCGLLRDEGYLPDQWGEG